MTGFEAYFTGDGSVGLYSYNDKDVYHSYFGALSEAYEKFILPIDLDTLISVGEINVLDICYGIGYNTKCFLNTVLKYNFLYEKNNFLKNYKFKNNSIETIHTDNILCDISNKTACKNKKIGSEDENYKQEKNEQNKNRYNYLKQKIKIDAIDSNSDLIKISPFLKTKKNRFDKNPKVNSEDLKSILKKIKYRELKKEYELNPLVFLLLIKSLYETYGENYLDKTGQIINIKNIAHNFLDKNMLNFANFYQNRVYKKAFNSKINAFLHNIYYGYISKRYKMNYIDAEKSQISVCFDNLLQIFSEFMGNNDVSIKFYTNDARKVLPELSKIYDVIFLDAFTPSIKPTLWTEEFFKLIYNHLNYDGILLTYSNSVAVRNAMLKNGFYIGKIFDTNSKKSMGTICSKNSDKILFPLNKVELDLLKTKAGITYHDNNFLLTNSDIINNRDIEFANSNLESASHYSKRMKI